MCLPAQTKRPVVAHTLGVSKGDAMATPNTYTNQNETGCCAVPNTADWDDKEITFDNHLFMRQYTRSFLYMPLNMSKVMTALQTAAQAADAEVPAQQVMILSHDVSPWKAEHLYAVSKPVPGADMVTLNGTCITKVFEGPYKDARKWVQAMQDMTTARNKHITTLYFDYTTCPKCAKHYGKHYVYGIAQGA